MIISFMFYMLPVIGLFSLLLYLIGYWIFRSRTGRLSFFRHLTVWVFLCCCCSLIYLTLLWYWPDITFFPEWHLLNLRPFIWVKETYQMGVKKMMEQLVLNIGMFIPLGLLLPMVFPGLRRFFRTALTVLAAILLIETLQYFMGRSADIDDVIMNLMGGMVGYLLFVVCNRVFARCGFWKKALAAF